MASTQTDSIKSAVCSCGAVFKNKGALRQHQRDSPIHPEITGRSKHSSDTAKCSCGKSFKDENALKQHERASPLHILKSPTTTTPSTPLTATASAVPDRVRCWCSKEFKTEQALLQHQSASPLHNAISIPAVMPPFAGQMFDPVTQLPIVYYPIIDPLQLQVLQQMNDMALVDQPVSQLYGDAPEFVPAAANETKPKQRKKKSKAKTSTVDQRPEDSSATETVDPEAGGPDHT